MTARMLWAAVLLAVGAGQLAQAWSGPLAAAVLVAAALIPLAVLGIGARAMPVPVLALMFVVCASAVWYAVSVRNGLNPAGALLHAVPNLLSAQRPAPATAPMLLPGALLALLISLWVAMRTNVPAQLDPPWRSGAGEPQDRTRSRATVSPLQSGQVAAPAGALALYGAGALLTAGTADPHGIWAAAIAAVAAAGWIGVSRMLVPAAVLAALAGMGTALVAPAAGFEPRTLVDPPGRGVDAPSPLPRIAAWHLQGDVELLRYKGSPGVKLRLVALADFNGASWSASTTYRPIGTVAVARLPGPGTVSAEADVTIAALDGPWLPTPGRTTAVSKSDVDVDTESGAVALRNGHEVQPGLTYRVSAVVPVPGNQNVATATVPSGPHTGLPGLPWMFGEYAHQVTEDATTPFEKAVALEHAVRDGRRHDATAPAGSSYARLEPFLFGEIGSEPGAGSGTSEQFATAFAMLARAVGLPSRVVVGFDGSKSTMDDDSTVIRGRDVLAWPEIYFTGIGWYSFDPTPRDRASTTGDAPLKRLVLDRLARRPTPSPVPPGSPTPPIPVAALPAAQRPARIDWLPGVGTIPVFLLGAVFLARMARRAGHRRAGARGAWAELLDLLILTGHPAPAWKPATDIAAALPAPEAASQLARAADRAAFGPPQIPPGRSDAQAWRALRTVRRAVRSATPRWRRLLWPIDPRPLLRRAQSGARHQRDRLT